MKRRDFTRAFGRTYDGPRLRNPFFAARTASRAVKYLLFAVMLASIGGLPAVLVYAPFMRYATIEVRGLTTLSANDVAATVDEVMHRRRALVIPGRNIFFAHTDTIAERLNAQFHFAALTLHREGRVLVVTVQERITEIAWTVAGKTYFIDLAGVATRDATPEALATIAARRANAAEVPYAPGVQPTMPIIDVRTGSETTLGSTVITADRLAHILATDSSLRVRGLLPLVYTIDTSTTPWLTVTVANGPSLLFDITAAPEGALAMYDAFADDRSGDLSSLLYIDLRFGNHVYSKNK